MPIKRARAYAPFFKLTEKQKEFINNMAVALGTLVVAISVLIALNADRTQLTRSKSDPISILANIMVLITLVSFYVGFRLMGLPMYVAMMLYCLVVFPLYGRVGTARVFADGRLRDSSDKRVFFISAGGIFFGVVIAALGAGYQALAVTPSLQETFNKAPMELLGIQFTWLETTYYSQAYVAAAYQNFRLAFVIVIILCVNWLIAAVVLFALHRRDRKLLLARVETFREKRMFAAALGTARKAAAMFPNERDVLNLKNNLEFVVSQERGAKDGHDGPCGPTD